VKSLISAEANWCSRASESATCCRIANHELTSLDAFKPIFYATASAISQSETFHWAAWPLIGGAGWISLFIGNNESYSRADAHHLLEERKHEKKNTLFDKKEFDRVHLGKQQDRAKYF
jgi:hypothetical protein